MSTFREEISSIRSMFKFISSDDMISDRAIARELKNTAYKFIKQQTDKRKLFASPNLFTNLDCLEMIKVPLAECCSYISPCDVSRSKNKIPKISEGQYGLLVQGVFSLDKKNRYKESTADRYANYLKLGLRNSQKFFWVFNDYLYISDPDIETVSISAYFEDEIDIKLYSCDSVIPICPNNPLDSDFKCPSYLLDDVKKTVYNTILQTYKNSIGDINSNQLDETK